MKRRGGLLAAVSLCALLGRGAPAVEPLVLHPLRIQLPGPPAKVLPADVDLDGRTDLFVVLAYTEVESIGVDRIEEMVQISEVIPALFDRREGRLYLSRPDGSFEPTAPLPLPTSVLAVASGPPSAPLLALTDSGVAEIRFDPQLDPPLALEPRIDDAPVFAGCGRFFSSLDWTPDLDGDGDPDVLLPARDGPAVYLSSAAGVGSDPAQRLSLPGDEQAVGTSSWRSYPAPRVGDYDGDGVVDLLVLNASNGRQRAVSLDLFRGKGDGTFRPAHEGPAGCARAASAVLLRPEDGPGKMWIPNLAYFGDLDGDGRAEAVTATHHESRKQGLRAGLKQMRKPRFTLAVHRLRDDLSLEEPPYRTFDVAGHLGLAGAFDSSQLFRDLDGDGRSDLVTVTFDFSILGQALRFLTTKRLSLGMDFHIWVQSDAGTFEPVEDLKLSEKLKIDLKNFELGRIAQFAGDFDADGRMDFVQLGRGKRVAIHLGRAGAAYAAEPDLVLELEEEPEDLLLVAIRDFDADGRSDLSVTRRLAAERLGESAAVALDLYLSGGGP